MSAFAESWLRTLTVATLQGGAVVLIVWLVCTAIRRLPAWVKGWLWWIACAQFLVRLFVSVPIPVSAIPLATGPASVDSPFVSSISAEAPRLVRMVSPSDGTVVRSSTSAGIATPSGPRPSVPEALLILWAVGVSIGVLVAARRLAAARGLVRRARPLTDPPGAELLAELFPGRRAPRLLESDEVKCPLLAGCIRPSIVVPAGFVTTSRPGEVRMAFAHEAAHLRRHDQWLSLAIIATQTAFFFHPLVWLAARETAIAREEACDLDVLRLCGESPAAYAQFLLKSAQARTPVAALGAAYGYRNLRRRLTMLNRPSVPSNKVLRRSWILLIAAMTTAAIPWSVGAQSATAAPKPAIASTSKSRSKATTPKIARKQTTTKATKKKGATTIAKAADAKAPAAAIASTIPGQATAATGMPARAANAAGAAASTARSANRTSTPAAIGGLPGETATAAIPGMAGAGAPAVATMPAGAMTAAAGGAGAGGAGAGGAPTVAAPEAVSTGPVNSQTSNEPSVAVAAGAEHPFEKLMSIQLTGADLEGSLISLLRDSGVDYVIKAKLMPEKVTCRLTNVTVEKALTMLLKASDQPLTYRIEGGVVIVVPRIEEAKGE